MNGPNGGQRMPRTTGTPGTQATLDDIIDEYVAQSPQPSYAALAEWIGRYPQYAQELTDFTLSWSVAERVPLDQDELPAEETAALVARHMSVVREIIARQSPSAVQAIKGLLAEARVRELSVRQLAEKTGLSVALVTKLDRRLIRYASIPRQVVADIAEALGREAQAVARYLQGGALLAPSVVSYRADEAPSLPEQQEFADAVRDDRMLSGEERERLLGYAAAEDKGA